MLFMSHTRLVKANLLNLSVLASTQPVLMLAEGIQVFMLLMDQLMRVPLPLNLHQQKVRMIHFLWRVPLILAKGLFACFNMIRKDAREREADRR
jgi:hypothetical protein